MCFFSKPKVDKPPPIPDQPTRESAATAAAGEEQRKKIAFRANQAQTKLTGPLGDVTYGQNIISRAVSLGGV